LSLLETRIDTFLATRGLEINSAKSFRIKWEHNKKFDFLGFTFHYILNPVQSKITEQRTANGELILRGGLYVYPSDLSVSLFKHKIKSVITSNLNSSPFTMVKLLNPIIRGWGNYFGIGTLRVFSRLDHFIYYRLWRYLQRKFKKVCTDRLVERFFQGISTPSGRLWQFHGTHTNQTVAAKLRKGEVQWLLLLCKLNTPVPAHTLKTSKALRSTSKYVDSSSHLIWYERMVASRSKTTDSSNNWTELYKRQKGLCPVCNTSLGYLLEDNLEIHHVGSIANAAKTNSSSHRVNRLDNLMLVHKTCHKGLHR
jgi:RNA-directed DNA polymerase